MRPVPVITRSERVDYKRCPTKWYWKWCLGLVPKAKTFGALDLGEWLHAALADWYVLGLTRNSQLYMHFNTHSSLAIEAAKRTGAPEHVIEKAEELALLGENMCLAYQQHYNFDPDVEVLQAEIPLEFSFPGSPENDIPRVLHYFKPDLVYRRRSTGGIWLMEHKSATSIRTEHLVIDDQARPYGAMAEAALRKAGLIKGRDQFKGITYNFLRKAFSDERERNTEGKALNKNGTISARQPAVSFVRKDITMTRAAKRVTLNRLAAETQLVTLVAQAVREKRVLPESLPKTPHYSCPKFCEYFAMCAAQDEGTDISTMKDTMFTRRNPYDYYKDTTSEAVSFEMG